VQRNLFLILLAFAIFARPLWAADQHWLRVSSDHFTVITDAGDKSGHEIAGRFEQMRAVFGDLLMRSKLRMSQPIEIIAIGGDKEFEQLAPVANGQAINAPGFWLPGEDRIFIVLNASQPDSWRAIEHPFAHYLLEYNYPLTPAWFDEGFAEYFASVRFTLKNMELGSDPELVPTYKTDLLGNQVETGSLKSLTELLQNPVWLAWPDLLTMKNRTANGVEGTHHTLFYAQSWILVHYLLSKEKMSAAGVYFNLVENQHVPVEQAIQQAFGMSVTQLDQELKNYFRSLKPLLYALDASKRANTLAVAEAVTQSALPFSLQDVGTSSKQIPLPEAQAMVDEMELRIPERRQEAFEQLQKLIADEKTETRVAHRALAWAYLQKGDQKSAFEELNAAVQRNANDPWTRFSLALASYRSGENGARVQGLANMMESLHIVIEEYPEFAKAYYLLGWARLAGGGSNAAVESLKMAVQLSPRQESYELLLAEACFSAKKFDTATGILERLKQSQDPRISHAAAKDLTDLPFIQKYGVPPADAASSGQRSGADQSSSAQPTQASATKEGSDEPEAKASPEESGIDSRPVKFLKAMLISVDCSKSPAAVLSLSHAGQALKLRTPDYKSAAVIGAPEFSCAWKKMRVNVNYRARGKVSGDLVSIEIPEPGR
jgi:tetratricopeptide (TPR) repeat protein